MRVIGGGAAGPCTTGASMRGRRPPLRATRARTMATRRAAGTVAATRLRRPRELRGAGALAGLHHAGSTRRAAKRAAAGADHARSAADVGVGGLITGPCDLRQRRTDRLRRQRSRASRKRRARRQRTGPGGGRAGWTSRTGGRRHGRTTNGRWRYGRCRTRGPHRRRADLAIGILDAQAQGGRHLTCAGRVDVVLAQRRGAGVGGLGRKRCLDDRRGRRWGSDSRFGLRGAFDGGWRGLERPGPGCRSPERAEPSPRARSSRGPRARGVSTAGAVATAGAWASTAGGWATEAGASAYVPDAAGAPGTFSAFTSRGGGSGATLGASGTAGPLPGSFLRHAGPLRRPFVEHLRGRWERDIALARVSLHELPGHHLFDGARGRTHLDARLHLQEIHDLLAGCVQQFRDFIDPDSRQRVPFVPRA